MPPGWTPASVLFVRVLPTMSHLPAERGGRDSKGWSDSEQGASDSLRWSSWALGDLVPSL